MTPDAVSPRQSTATPANRLAVQAPGDPRFAPLVETAVRIFVHSLPGGRAIADEVQRELVKTFRRAAAARPRVISITLLCAPPTLEATVAPAGGEPIVMHFPIG